MQKEGEFLVIDDEVDWNLEIGAYRWMLPDRVQYS